VYVIMKDHEKSTKKKAGIVRQFQNFLPNRKGRTSGIQHKLSGV
jgi:N-glycosylase/DNA lyase